MSVLIICPPEFLVHIFCRYEILVKNRFASHVCQTIFTVAGDTISREVQEHDLSIIILLTLSPVQRNIPDNAGNIRSRGVENDDPTCAGYL